jgi:hypothetical protein
MAIYTGRSKGGIGNVYPENAIDAELSRVEPILTPEQLKTRHLFGIPLVSRMKDPITGKHQVMTSEMLNDIIIGAVNQAERECKIDISPVQRRIKQAFDRVSYEAYGYMSIPFRPVTSIEKLSITPSNGLDVYVLDPTWIETSYLVRGQINIIPMTAAFIQGGYVSGGPTSAALFFMTFLGGRGWIPAWWQIEFTSGFRDGMVPRILNELIGTLAALEGLSMLATTYAQSQSHSLGIDGLSQSQSGPGPMLFKTRTEELIEKRDRLTGRIRSLFGTGIFSSYV